MRASPRQSADGSPPMRLARYLAGAGIASRRTCEEHIRAGRVQVNGACVQTPACTVVPGVDRVEHDGRAVVWRAPSVCLMLNKPAGYTCSARDAHAAHLVHELIPPHFGRLFTIGRLDRDSEGLLLLTDDGDLAQHLAHPGGGVHKTYRAEVLGVVSGSCLARLRAGLWERGEWLQPLAVTAGRVTAGRTCLRLVLGEGRKREIRRLCRAVGLRLVRLQRVALGGLELGDLPTGAWRHLEPAEREGLWGQQPRPRRRPDRPAAKAGDRVGERRRAPILPDTANPASR